MYNSILSLTLALDGMGGQRHVSAALHAGNTRYPLYRRLGGPQDRSGRLWKISPPPGFDPRTFQLVGSCYTDWGIPAYKLSTVLSYFVTRQLAKGRIRWRAIEKNWYIHFLLKRWELLLPEEKMSASGEAICTCGDSVSVSSSVCGGGGGRSSKSPLRGVRDPHTE